MGPTIELWEYAEQIVEIGIVPPHPFLGRCHNDLPVEVVPDQHLRFLHNSLASTALIPESSWSPLQKASRTDEVRLSKPGREGYGRGDMSKLLLPDDLWAQIEPLLPMAPPRPKGGGTRIADRACLTGTASSSRPGSGRNGCSWRWAVTTESPRGDGCATSKRPGAGTDCIQP